MGYGAGTGHPRARQGPVGHCRLGLRKFKFMISSRSYLMILEITLNPYKLIRKKAA